MMMSTQTLVRHMEYKVCLASASCACPRCLPPPQSMAGPRAAPSVQATQSRKQTWRKWPPIPQNQEPSISSQHECEIDTKKNLSHMVRMSLSFQSDLSTPIPSCKHARPRFPGSNNPQMPENLAPTSFQRVPKTETGEKGLTKMLPAISPECPINNHGHWAISLILACTASYQYCRNYYPVASKRVYAEPGELPKDDEDNAPTDLRPTGVSSDRHTCVAQILWT